MNVCLIAGVLCYHLVYKLHFFVERNDLSPDVRPIFSPTYRNWWKCASAGGTCQYDMPEPDSFKYCRVNQTNSIWDHDEEEFVSKSELINCSMFNMAEDYQAKAGQLWITTYEERVKERKDSQGSWQQIPQVAGTRLASGAEQIVIFHGTLPGGLGVKATTLGQMQGFINHAHESHAKARRIPFARKGEWLTDGETRALLKHDWASQYPKKAVRYDDPKPECFFNSTGCFQVADVGMGVYCHLTELLYAAGVKLEATYDHDATYGWRCSACVSGIVLKVQLKLTNMDVHDFWTWPIGRKPKYVIEVSTSRGSDAEMYRTYHDQHDSDDSVRLRTDHYGIHVVTSSTTCWAEFSISGLISTLVIAAGVVKYAHIFVNHILVSAYSNLGCIHISRLYRYNTTTKSAHEE